jgi:hypothetical protein
VFLVDHHHAEIRDGLRDVPGCTVRDTSGVGEGFPDLVVGFRSRTILIEIKDGAKKPSARKLTAAQQHFAANWSGSPIWVVQSLAQALDVLMKEARAK